MLANAGHFGTQVEAEEPKLQESPSARKLEASLVYKRPCLKQNTVAQVHPLTRYIFSES